MAILNGFLRGAHDPEITANVDNKQYSGVATKMLNWIGTKRGGIAKRAPFKVQSILDRETIQIPYAYDDDEKYMLLFFKDDDGNTKYKVKKYINGQLIDSNFGGSNYIQPVFTSNNQDGYIITTKTATVPDGYKAFNDNNYVYPSSTNFEITIEFPESVLITNLSYVYGRESSDRQSGGYLSTEVIATDENGGDISIETHSNPGFGAFFPTSGTFYHRTSFATNPNGIFFKKLTLKFSNYSFNNRGGSYAASVGSIKITGQVKKETSVADSPLTLEQIYSSKYFNAYRSLHIVGKDYSPYELKINFTQPTYDGLDLKVLGNPTLVRVFQQRLIFSGFSNYPREIKASKTGDFSKFALNTTETLATDPIAGAISDMKNGITAIFAGRQMLYAQSMDGLGSLSSGGDDIPLTPVQIAAGLRNETPLSRTIEPVKQDQIIFCVGADNKTVYALDYDYQMARIPLSPINEHCITLFDAGIKQMKIMNGRLPLLVFLLNDGTLIMAISYRSGDSFYFHAFPQAHASGTIKSIETLINTQSGYDTLFAIIEYPNGIRTHESLESYTDYYTKDKGIQYFRSHILLDMQQEFSVNTMTDISFTYTGTKSSIGRCLFKVSDSDVKVETLLPDKEMKLFIDGVEIICRNVMSDDSGWWAECSAEPAVNVPSDSYLVPTRVLNNPAYLGLDVRVFDGDDFYEKVSEDYENNTITIPVPVYNYVIGIPYNARAEFVNLTDASIAGYEKVVNNIAACITYGTGIKLGTESVLEKVGFTEYHFKDWKDYILPDENLRNIPLADTGRKDKKIVVECDYPFPANITFITYDIKATGVR